MIAARSESAPYRASPPHTSVEKRIKEGKVRPMAD